MPAPKGSGQLPRPFCSEESTDFVDCKLVINQLLRSAKKPLTNV